MNLQSRYACTHSRIHLAFDKDLNGDFESLRQKIKTCRLLTTAVGSTLLHLKFGTEDLYFNWFFMKYCCRLLHCIYRLMWKVVTKYSFCPRVLRSRFHYLVNGPRHLKQNINILKELVGKIISYTDGIYQGCGLLKNPKLLDTLCAIMKRVNRSLIIFSGRYAESASFYTNGLPMKKQQFWPWKIL